MRRQNIIRYSILGLAIFAFLIPTVYIETGILHATRNNISYPSDATYVNLSVAQHLAFDQVWGISGYRFSPASASPLYTIVLAIVYFIFGSHLIIALLVNGGAAIWLLTAVQRFLVKSGVGPALQLAFLLAIVFLVPLPVLVVSGREFTVQLLACVLFMTAFQENPNCKMILILGPTMIAGSYATVLILGVACFILIRSGAIRQAIRLLAVSLFPVILFGGLALSKHFDFIPNAVLLQFTTAPADLGLLGATTIIWMALLFGRRKLVTYGVIGLLSLPLAYQSVLSFGQIGDRCVILYGQLSPVKQFVRHYYYGTPMATNDIGVMTYFSAGRKFDLTGVSNIDVLRSRRRHTWSREMADSLTKKAEMPVAILHDSQELGAGWSKVASWEIKNNNPARPDYVDFYSIDTFNYNHLTQYLREFQARLPAYITVRYYAPID